MLDVLHDATDGAVAVFVAQGIHIQLISPVQVLVHQDRPLRVYLHRIVDIPLQVSVAASPKPAVSRPMMHFRDLAAVQLRARAG